MAAARHCFENFLHLKTQNKEIPSMQSQLFDKIEQYGVLKQNASYITGY